MLNSFNNLEKSKKSSIDYASDKLLTRKTMIRLKAVKDDLRDVHHQTVTKNPKFQVSTCSFKKSSFFKEPLRSDPKRYLEGR